MAEHDLEMNGGQTGCGVLPRSIEVHAEELETLVEKVGSMMLPYLPTVIISVCFTLLLQLVKNYNLFDGELAIRVAEPFLVLAILSSLATLRCSQEWGSEVVGTSRKQKKVLADIESCTAYSAVAESQFEEPLRHFSWRYLMLAVMRMAYLFCFLLGCNLAGVGVLRPTWHQCWPLLPAWLSSLIIMIIEIVHIYRSYWKYRGYSRLLSSTG